MQLLCPKTLYLFYYVRVSAYGSAQQLLQCPQKLTCCASTPALSVRIPTTHLLLPLLFLHPTG
jgi:hypothetical protein